MAADTIRFDGQYEEVVDKFFPAYRGAIRMIMLLQDISGNPDDVPGLAKKLSNKGRSLDVYSTRNT
jgi:hypothetical protein